VGAGLCVDEREYVGRCGWAVGVCGLRRGESVVWSGAVRWVWVGVVAG
jgi:hypothetical protein